MRRRRLSAGDLVLLKERCDEVAATLKSMANPTRLLILCSLAERPRTVSELIDTVGISQSLMSQYLKRMKSEGLLASSREGTSIRYSIRNRRILNLLKILKKELC